MKALLGQFSRFFVAGALSASVQFSVLIGIVEIFSVSPIFASTLGYLAGAFINYLLNHYFSFKSSLPHRQALVRFSINSLFGFFINFFMMYIFMHYYPYLSSQVLTSIIILIWNFLIHRCWTFRAKE
ncbi:MAG: GtrA family protein [Rickettsia endosymbiont of Ixodes persulcatus]|nr:GtrA family protein [Rickettsia endosymbiont of Ixodes persulcatus]